MDSFVHPHDSSGAFPSATGRPDPINHHPIGNGRDDEKTARTKGMLPKLVTGHSAAEEAVSALRSRLRRTLTNHPAAQHESSAEEAVWELKSRLRKISALPPAPEFSPPDRTIDKVLEQTVTSSLESDRLVGQILDERYVISALVKTGGMGDIYRARHRTLGKIKAIKVLKQSALSNDSALNRFNNEAKAASSLDHANLVTVHDFGLTPAGEPYLVMDYVEGQSLADIIREHGAMPVSTVLQILEQSCEGMQYAHEKGIIHRDLKPSNIIISRTAHGAPLVKIVDFGIAKMTHEVCSDQQITRTGEVFGSPLYMSPEQCHGHRELDVRSDIYSMGCVTYEALRGQPPFHGGSAMQTMYKHINERPARFSSADEPELCALEKVVMRALEKNPERRYQSMSEMRQEIRAIRTGAFQAAVCSPLETLKQRFADSAINLKEAIGLLLLAASLWFYGDSQMRADAFRPHFLTSDPANEKLPKTRCIQLIVVAALIGLVIGIFIPPRHISFNPFQDNASSTAAPKHKRAVHHSISRRHQTEHK